MAFQHLSNRWLAGFAIVLALVGCDVQRIAELEVGVTTESEVLARWGEPAAVYAEADGSKALEYPRQPAGQINFMVVIGRDGKVAALRQVLTPANFANVETGWDRAQVRRLLGLPAKTQRYELRREEVWDWRFSDDAENKLFSVTFDIDGRVTATATTIDPKEMGGR